MTIHCFEWQFSVVVVGTLMLVADVPSIMLSYKFEESSIFILFGMFNIMVDKYRQFQHLSECCICIQKSKKEKYCQKSFHLTKILV